MQSYKISLFLIKNDIFVWIYKTRTMNKLLFVPFLLIALMFVSCETDIDVNAEYKDIPVIYGVISPSESNHYIKINKAFLGETNALDLAADANNFNYADGELDITIDEYSLNGTKVKTYSTGAGTVTRTVNEIPKDAGIFDNSTNVLYKFVEPSIDRTSTYKLRVVNTTLNKEITAETEIVNDIIISSPPNTNGKFQFWIGSVGTGNANNKTISVTTGADMGRVEAILVFNYYDIYTLASGKDSVLMRVEMHLGETITASSLGGESLEWELKGETFFDKIATTVPSPPNDLSHRRLDNISLEFLIAGTELNTFMAVSAPSNTVNQDKPNYTNVTNGIGIFSSREKEVWNSSIDPIASNQVNIQNTTIEYLATHSSLISKGFCFGSTGVGFPVAPCVQQ